MVRPPIARLLRPEPAGPSGRLEAPRAPAGPSRAGLLVALSLLLLGAVIGGDYGKSWDEYVHVRYAEETLEIYEGARSPSSILLNLRYYGPFYSVVVEVTQGLVQRLRPPWGASDARHFLYFLSFPLAVLSLHSICARFMGRPAALLATLLFATQPVLFGHAFINPKDAPFMAFFLASVAAALAAADSRTGALAADRAAPAIESGIGGGAKLRAAWQAAPRGSKLLVGGAAIVLALGLLEAFRLNATLAFAEDLLTRAYHGEAWPPINSWFQRVAQDAHRIPLDQYVAKLHSAYFRLRWLVVLGLTSFLAGSARWILRGPAFRLLWRLLLAGLLLGLATAIRIQGLFAGALASALLLLGLRRRALLPLAVYWPFGLAVTALAWPALWDDPLRRFVQVLEVMGDFGWGGEVLYRGQVYSSYDLPWHYLPELLLLQLTLPVLPLALAGVVRALRRDARPGDRLQLVAMLAWFAIPVGLAMLASRSLYDNFRQMLFALPPLFLFAGIAIDGALRLRLARPWRLTAIAVLLLPGALAIAALHPYQYIYYNALAGGVRGAFGRYELDYWCTASREAIERLNDVASPGAVVGTNKDSDQVVPFARPDLVIEPGIVNENRQREIRPDYVIACTRAGGYASLLDHPNLDFTIDAGGAPILGVLAFP